VKSPIGGVKQMHRLSEQINLLGRESIIIQQDADFHPSWFTSQVKTISYDSWRNLSDLSSERDIVILPETYLNQFASYGGGLATVIFNQNGSYTFGLKSDQSANLSPLKIVKAYNQTCIKHILCVSEYDRQLLSSFCNVPASRISLIRNSIDPRLVNPGGKAKKRIVSFMPRKNRFDAHIVTSLLFSQAWFNGWKLMPIVGKPHHEVVSDLQSSLVFLSFGHPEGFGLPVAEALACGCAVVGYSGLGGREIFDLVSDFPVAYGVEYGDWNGFLQALKTVVKYVDQKPESFSALLSKSSKAIRSYYDDLSMRNSVEQALIKIEASIG